VTVYDQSKRDDLAVWDVTLFFVGFLHAYQQIFFKQNFLKTAKNRAKARPSVRHVFQGLAFISFFYNGIWSIYRHTCIFESRFTSKLREGGVGSQNCLKCWHTLWATSYAI